MKKKYTVGSLYAGVGGICQGFKKVGFKLEWANEYDKNACITYRKNFRHKLYEEDVMKLVINSLLKVNILTAGFPCQPFSVAGYREGFNDHRGNHFFRILDFIDELEPEVVFLENVKNLKGHDNGKTLQVIEKEIRRRGYGYVHTVLNTAVFGNIPQNRERTYIVCFKDPIAQANFKFPGQIKLNKRIHDFFEDTGVDEKYFYDPDVYMYDMLTDTMINPNTLYQFRRVYVRENQSNMCPTLTANMGTGGHNVPLRITENGRFRKLTPRECFNFQGFTRNMFRREFILPQDMADSHLYKQAGNSVSIPVIARIARNIKKALDLVVDDVQVLEDKNVKVA